MTKFEIDLVKRLYYSKSLKIAQKILKNDFGIYLTQKQIKGIARKYENNN